MRGDLRDDGTGGLTRGIIGAGIEVHRRLGPGLLETTYEVCLAAELRHRGFSVECQVPLPVVYRDVRLEQVGLLFNFNVHTLAVGGFKRILLDRGTCRRPFVPFDPSYAS